MKSNRENQIQRGQQLTVQKRKLSRGYPENCEIVTADKVEKKILILRNQKVMMDHHLADLYGVETKYLKRAVKRNFLRFPADFMFRLNESEFDCLRCQIGTSNGRGGSRYLPYAFTEQGVAMLSSVLNSERAILVNVEIMRAFVNLRRLLSTHADLARKLNELEKKYDMRFKAVFEAIRKLMSSPDQKKSKIGF